MRRSLPPSLLRPAHGAFDTAPHISTSHPTSSTTLLTPLPSPVALRPRPQEIFLQLSGGMAVEVVERGARRRIEIPEGHVFVLPGRVPHSPQRLAGTVGLVLERDRRPGEIDGLRWCVCWGEWGV